MSVLNVLWLPPAAPVQVCSLEEEAVMILLLTTRLKYSLRPSSKAPSKQPLINFNPATPMSPKSAATKTKKTFIKSFRKALTAMLQDFRAPSRKWYKSF